MNALYWTLGGLILAVLVIHAVRDGHRDQASRRNRLSSRSADADAAAADVRTPPSPPKPRPTTTAVSDTPDLPVDAALRCTGTES